MFRKSAKLVLIYYLENEFQRSVKYHQVNVKLLHVNAILYRNLINQNQDEMVMVSYFGYCYYLNHICYIYAFLSNFRDNQSKCFNFQSPLKLRETALLILGVIYLIRPRHNTFYFKKQVAFLCSDIVAIE